MTGGEKIRERVRRLKVEDRIDSDHQSLMVYVEEKGTREKQKKEEERRYGTRWKQEMRETERRRKYGS